MALKFSQPELTTTLAPNDASYLALGAHANLTNERILTGTANQILLTDAGAGNALTLSLTGPYTPATYTLHGLLLGQGTSSITAVAVPSTTGFFLRSVANADPVWSGLTLPNSATRGDLLFASAANAIGNLADVAVGSYLRSGGIGLDPLWSTLTLPNTVVQGDLPIATAANVVGVVTAVEAGRILRSAGASTVPAYTATPVLGLAGTTQGSLGLSGATTGVLTLATPASTTSYSFTFPAAAPANRGMAYFSSAAGQLAASATPTDGQLLIGSSAGNPAVANLTADTGIVITNAANSIMIGTNLTGATASTSASPVITSATSTQGADLRYAREGHNHGLGPMNNAFAYQQKDSGGTARTLLTVTAGDLIEFGNAAVTNVRLLSESLLFSTATAGILGTFSNFPVTLKTNNTTALTLDTSQNAFFATAKCVGINETAITPLFTGDGTTLPALQLSGGATFCSLDIHTSATASGSTLGQLVFGSSGCAATAKFGGGITSKTTAASGTNMTADLALFTVNAGVTKIGLTFNAPGTAKFGVGIDNTGVGFQHKRATTSVAALGTSTLTLTWNTSFVDTNYTMALSVVDETGAGDITWVKAAVLTKTATTFTISVTNANAVSARSATINAIGVHD